MPTKPIQLTEAQAQALSRRILPCIQQSDNDLSTYNAGVAEGRELFKPRPEVEDGPWEGSCSLHMPLCEIVLVQQLARLDRGLLCVEPVYHVEAYSGGEARECARRTEKFLQMMLVEHLGYRAKMLPAIASALVDGSASIYATWRSEWGDALRWQTVEAPNPALPEGALPSEEGAALVPDGFGGWQGLSDENGYPVPYVVPERKLVEQEALVYDLPELRLLETGHVPDSTTAARWGTYPAANANVQEATITFVRYQVSGDDLLRGVETSIYDEAAVDAVGKPDAFFGRTPEDELDEVNAGTEVSGVSQWGRYNLIEAYVRHVPLPENGESEKQAKKRNKARTQDWLVVMAETSEKILRAIPNPWAHKKRPIAVGRPFRKRFGVHGTSTPDLVGDAQETMTQVLRDSVDATHLQLKPPLKVKRGLLSRTDEWALSEQVRPGGVLQFDSDPDAILPLLAVMGDPTAGLAWYQNSLELAHRNSGVNDNTTGLITGRHTATEASIATTQGDALFSYLAQNVAEWMDEIAGYLLALCYQYVGNESIQKIWALSNPDAPPPPEGMVPGELELLLAVEGAYKVRAWGTTEASNRAMAQQKWGVAFTPIWQLPMVQASPSHQYAVARAFIGAMDLGDPQEILGTEEEWVQLSQQMRDEQAAQVEQQAMLQRQQQEQQDASGQERQAQDAQKEREGRDYEMAMADRAHQQKLEQMDRQAQLRPQPMGAMR